MKDSGALPLPKNDIELIPNCTVDGEPALKLWDDPISKGKEPGHCTQACPNLMVYLTHKDKAYRIGLGYTREVDNQSQEIFNFILSTFKFLN